MMPSEEDAGRVEKCQHVPFLPCRIFSMQIEFPHVLPR